MYIKVEVNAALRPLRLRSCEKIDKRRYQVLSHVRQNLVLVLDRYFFRFEWVMIDTENVIEVTNHL